MFSHVTAAGPFDGFPILFIFSLLCHSDPNVRIAPAFDYSDRIGEEPRHVVSASRLKEIRDQKMYPFFDQARGIARCTSRLQDYLSKIKRLLI